MTLNLVVMALRQVCIMFILICFFLHTAISTVLLDALSDPATHTAKCLKVLSQTTFVHFIDAPSLALIMPVLHRALDLRSTETKKMSAQIIGNMYALTDKKVKHTNDSILKSPKINR